MMNTQKTVLALALAAAFSQPVQAADVVWNCANSYWDVTGCWNPTVKPTNADTVHVWTVGGAKTLLKIDNATGTANAYMMFIDATTAGTTVTLQQSGGSLSVGNNEVIGYTDVGAFTQSGGTHTVNNSLILGYSSGSNATNTLSDTERNSVE